MSGEPWWASGRDPDEGIDPGQDPLDAHREARGGAGGNGAENTPAWLGDAVDLVARFATEASRRMAARAGDGDGGATAGGESAGTARPDGGPAADGIGPTPPHPPGEVCDACPFCIALRAVRQVRPEVIGHLSEAAHHLSLALKAFADAQVDATGGPDDLEHIDLDLE